MTNDPDDTAETVAAVEQQDAVLSLQEQIADDEDVQAHAAPLSATSIVTC